MSNVRPHKHHAARSMIEPPSPPPQSRIGFGRMARASALAPLLLVGPLLLFVVFFSHTAPLRMPEGFGPALVVLGVLPVYVALISAYLALALVLRALRLLTLKALLLVSGAASIAIGWQFLNWAAEASAPLSEQVESFAFGTGVYLVVSFSMSWLWWRLARGSSAVVAPPRQPASEA